MTKPAFAGWRLGSAGVANYVGVFVHLVWATRQRHPLPDAAIEPAVHDAVAAACQQLKCRPMAVGGMPDHIHILVALHPTVSLATVVGRAKGSSSHLVSSVLLPSAPFQWQSNYGAFSVSPRGVAAVVAYIRNKKQYHADGTLIASLEATDSSRPPPSSPRERASS